VVGETPPDAAIGFVVLIGGDDFVARLEALQKCLGEDIGILRGGGAEVDLFDINAEVFRQASVGRIHFLTGAA